jgi:hypothetical protein
LYQLSNGKNVPLLIDGFEVKLNKINVFSGERPAGESGFIVKFFWKFSRLGEEI